MGLDEDGSIRWGRPDRESGIIAQLIPSGITPRHLRPYLTNIVCNTQYSPIISNSNRHSKSKRKTLSGSWRPFARSSRIVRCGSGASGLFGWNGRRTTPCTRYGSSPAARPIRTSTTLKNGTSALATPSPAFCFGRSSSRVCCRASRLPSQQPWK